MKKITITLVITFVCALFTASTALAQALAPQGRLTLISGTPVMATEVATPTNTMYYTPYVGNSLPRPNGSGGYSNVSFAELTLTLGSTSSYEAADVFAFYNTTTTAWSICSQPWSSATSRGSGASTTQLAMVGGFWVNAYALSCYNSSTNYNVTAQYGVYLGSFVPSGGGVVFTPHPPASAGGSSPNIGIWNAYNRVPVTASNIDSSAWTYASSTWRAADGNTLNRITWIDGLAQSSFRADYFVITNSSATNGQANTGISVNPGSPVLPEVPFISQLQNTGAIISVPASYVSPPLFGVNVVEAVESVNVGTESFYGNLNLLTLQIDY